MDSFTGVAAFIHMYNNYSSNSGLNSVFYGFAVISFILSLILLFFGKRLLRLSLGIIGFLTFGSIPFRIYISSDYSTISPTSILIIMLVIGLFAASILSYFTKFGIYIIGIASGAQFGVLLCEIIYRYSYSRSVILLVVLIILFGLVGILLTHYFMSYMVIGITTFNGFLLFRSGIQYVLIGNHLRRFYSNSISYEYGSYWGILLGSLFVGCLGTIWQYCKYKNYPYLKNMESNQTPGENC